MSDSLFDTIDSSVGLGTAATFSQSLWENIYDEEDNYAEDVETSDVCKLNLFFKNCILNLISNFCCLQIEIF